MKWSFKKPLVKLVFILTLIVVAGHSFPISADTKESRTHVLQMTAHMRFEKILGLIGNSDISYGDISPSVNERIIITPDGAILSENSTSLTANSRSHPGEVIIHDGRAQQFKLITNRYTSNKFVRPIRALCSFGTARNVPCEKISSSKKRDSEKIHVGMVIQILDTLSVKKAKTKPSFDLSVVYL